MVEISPEKNYIVRGGRDGIVSCYDLTGEVLWQYKTGSVLATPSKPVTRGVTSLALSKMGLYIVLGSVNKKVSVLSRDMQMIYRFECDDEVFDIKMSEVGESMVLVSGSTLYFMENIGFYPMLFDDVREKVNTADDHGLNLTKMERLYKASENSYKKKQYFNRPFAN